MLVVLRGNSGSGKSTVFGGDSLRRWYHGWNPLDSVAEHSVGPEEMAEEVVDRTLAGR